MNLNMVRWPDRHLHWKLKVSLPDTVPVAVAKYFIPLDCILALSLGLDDTCHVDVALVNDASYYCETRNWCGSVFTGKSPGVKFRISYVQDLPLFEKLVLALKEQKRNEVTANVV